MSPSLLPPTLTAPTPQDPLSSLERELALQLQIAEAARRLSCEENLGRQARRQRKHAVLQEERKLRELERCLGEQRRHSGRVPLGPGECALPGPPASGSHVGGWAATAFGQPGLCGPTVFEAPEPPRAEPLPPHKPQQRTSHLQRACPPAP